MLNKPDDSIKEYIFNRILRITVILLVYSLGYYICDAFARWGIAAISWRDFLKGFYSSTTKYHLWYLYLYIAYLAVIPFLKALTKNLDDRYFYYMILIALFFQGILPTVEFMLFQGRITLNGNLKITWLLNNAILFPCLGYFMQFRIDLDAIKKKLPALWLINIICILTSCYMTYYKGQITGVLNESNSQAFYSSYVVINCMTIFITIRYAFENREIASKLKKIILSIGSCTFGIYLWHALVRTLIENDIITFLNKISGHHMINACAYCLVCMAISYFIVFFLSKIPVLKKFVGF